MTHSVIARKLIQEFEGFSPTAYLDPNGIPTIAYGHTSGVRMGQTCGIGEATAWLDADMKAAESCIGHLVKVQLTQNQFDALCSFVFNVGCPKFSRSDLLDALNLSDFAQAASEFERWVRAGSEVLPGLVRRRKAEKELFQGGGPSNA